MAAGPGPYQPKHGIGYPRIERSTENRPIIDIGPYGGMASSAAIMYAWLPEAWPSDWPESGVIDAEDPRVLRYLSVGL